MLSAMSSHDDIRFGNFFQECVTYASDSCANDDVGHSFTNFWDVMGESDSENLSLEKNGFQLQRFFRPTNLSDEGCC